MAKSRIKHNKNLEVAKWYHMVGVDYVPKSINIKKNLAIQPPINNKIGDKEPIIEVPQNTAQEEQTRYTNNIYHNPKVIAARTMADQITTLEQLKQSLENFDLCDLKHGAQNLVFADGVSNAKIMLIGEAPGANEDEKGIPFCGISGQLLDNMLATIGLFRNKNLYITNTVFWRPPSNRQPSIEEVEICKPFLEKHIALIQPQIIVLIGSVALNALMGNQYQISTVRGKTYKYSNPYISNIDTTAIFHPAYLIRQPLKKKPAWFDVLKLKRILTAKNIII